MQVQPMRPPSIFELLDALDEIDPINEHEHEEDPRDIISQLDASRRQPGMFAPPSPMIMERNEINAKPMAPKPEYEIAGNNLNTEQPLA